ncbi:actin-105-like [Vanessa cardui]|uniref:actin-105-like n=1 Tax=Vanessa cardui TaxID=171605 RepID=UPI001F12B5DE|nr:actin-105-like [Vanessa cardui]
MPSHETVSVVLDTGSSSTKAGFAGESFPRCITPTTVGRFRQHGLIDGTPDVYFGTDAIKKRGISKLTWPVKDGMIDNWDEMEKLWHHIFYRELHVAPEESQIMIAIHPLTSREDKKRMAEILFESFTIHDLFLAVSTSLVLHASGRTSGVVWENGHSCSYASPVFEGFPLKHATVCSKINGNVLTDRLQNLLGQIGYSFTTPIERDILEKMKSGLCYVATDYNKASTTSKISKESVPYYLPDGQHVLIGSEAFDCPELLFQPNLQGFDCPNVTDVICSSIYKCDMEYKSLFFDNIVLSGGSSMFKGFSERLTVELSRRVIDLPGVKANVVAMPSRNLGVWIGGSILASLESSKGFWMTRDEYEDGGAERVLYKFY